jgi:1-deoxy-D-xylulose-5-phosphate reductoisomerase
MVEYVDGSTIAQLGSPDMRIPIAHTLAYPARMATPAAPLDLARIGKLEFETPDPERFPALRLARQALEAGGGEAIVLNAANEIAVAAFLAGRIGFLDIVALVEQAIVRTAAPAPRSIADVLDIDRAARDSATQMIETVPA